MILILQIILTVWAFRVGWRWKSLIPMGIAMILGYFIGFFIGVSGGSDLSVIWIGGILDFFLIAVIILMIAFPPGIYNDDEIKEY